MRTTRCDPTLIPLLAAVAVSNGVQGEYMGKQYHAADLAGVLERAWASGVGRIVVTGGCLEDARAALRLTEADERLTCTVGVHPTRCGEFEAAGGEGEGEGEAAAAAHLEALHALIEDGRARGKVVAVGECGLDYARLNFCDADAQRRGFVRQLELARRSGLPLFLHCREAAEDTLAILSEHRDKWTRAVVHSFDGTQSELEAFLALDGMYVGINGCSLKTEDNLRVAASVPLDRLMIEVRVRAYGSAADAEACALRWARWCERACRDRPAQVCLSAAACI